MGIELTRQNYDYFTLDEGNQKKSCHDKCTEKCTIDTNTIRGKILFGLTCASAILIVGGIIVGLAIIFAIL